MYKGKDSHGIMGKNGEINFGKLNRQIDNAITADKRYWTENDAKIRAVSNKVSSYDEFCDIVKASHLKPLEKGDRISDMKAFTQPWNSLARHDHSETSSSGVAMASTSAISSISHFTRAWRCCKSSRERYDLLVIKLSSCTIERIFRTEIGGGVLGDIISVLAEEFQEEHADAIVNLLMTLSRCGRFTLSLQFLSDGERDRLRRLLDDLHDNTPEVGQLKQLYES